jgi:peptide deformylase
VSDHEHDEHERDEEAAERDAEQELRRRVALAQIRQYGDTVLRMRANEVEQFDDELARVAERMVGLMHDAEGVGLAATQVGILRRLFVFNDDGEDRVLVNPAITRRAEETELDSEGCLSLGPVRVPVERSQAVTIEARDAAGEPVRLELEGLPARVVQHELDHLDGVLILDRTDPDSRREALSQLRPRIVLSR